MFTENTPDIYLSGNWEIEMTKSKSGTIQFFRDANTMPGSSDMADRLKALGFRHTSVPTSGVLAASKVTTTRVSENTIRIRVEHTDRNNESARLERGGYKLADSSTVIELE